MQLLDWVQVVQVFATLGLVYYAYVTINEARKDRKRATIERILEKIHFPMFEILDRSRNEDGARAIVRSRPVQIGDSQEPGEKWAYVLTPEELQQIREMVERFGYYLGPTELGRLRMNLETHEATGTSFGLEKGQAPWLRFRTEVFDSHWRFFNSKCKELISELEQLTGIKTD